MEETIMISKSAKVGNVLYQIFNLCSWVIDFALPVCSLNYFSVAGIKISGQVLCCRPSLRFDQKSGLFE